MEEYIVPTSEMVVRDIRTYNSYETEDRIINKRSIYI